MDLKQETKDISSKIFEITLGISYEEFEQLDFDEQQELMAMNRKKLKRENLEEVVMIGSGEHSTITKTKKGELIMIGSGENSCFVEIDISPEESRQELNNKIDDMLDSSSSAFVKKLERRIRN